MAAPRVAVDGRDRIGWDYTGGPIRSTSRDQNRNCRNFLGVDTDYISKRRARYRIPPAIGEGSARPAAPPGPAGAGPPPAPGPPPRPVTLTIPAIRNAVRDADSACTKHTIMQRGMHTHSRAHRLKVKHNTA